MKKQRFDSVWDALGASPAAAANMKVRADLMIALRETQSRLSDLLRGRITKFSLDALMEIASRGGLSVRVEIARLAA